MPKLAIAALALTTGLGALGVGAATAATLNPIGKFEHPTFVTSEPNSEDLLVAQRFGQIELVDHGQVSLLADLSSLVGCPQSGCAGERGLMSLAVAPDFSTSGHLYVDYANDSSGQIHIDELTVSGGSAPLSSRRPVATIDHSEESNHNGGQLQFGPDGKLYASTGDGGGSDDQHHHSQDPNSLLGKILRIDPNATASMPAVWSLGLRNPFRFSFDSLTGDMVIGDVGQGAREEVDFAPRQAGGGVGGEGANYGWNCREGFVEGPADDLSGEGCQTAFTAGSFTEPVFDYPHTDPGDGGAHGCAIIGGYVVRDPSLGDLYGRYLYGDLCVGELRSLLLPSSAGGRASDDRSEGLTVANLNSFGEDSCHRLYVVSGDGAVARLEGAVPASCPPPPAGAEARKSGGKQATAKHHHRRARTRLRLSGPHHPVAPGALAALRATVGPCRKADRGRRVRFFRGGRKIGSDRIDGSCRAYLSVKVKSDATFRAKVSANGRFRSDLSNRIRVRTAAP